MVVLAGSLVAVRLRHRCSSIVLLCNSVDVLPIAVGANGSQRRNETLGPGGRIAVKRLDVVAATTAVSHDKQNRPHPRRAWPVLLVVGYRSQRE